MESFDIFIAGAGAAGIAAAEGAWQAGCRSILLADRNPAPGGVLRQCFHHGFGNDRTGPEYTEDLLRDFPAGVELCLNAAVLSVSPDRTAVLSTESGLREIRFRRMILAAGCREIPIGALPVAGSRPAGVYTAGQMQALMNLEGRLPEGPVVIIGSGDLGLIMANAIHEAGIPVTLVEMRDACGGMAVNRKYVSKGLIPVLCGVTVSELQGYPSLTGVLLSDGRELPCRTLLTAVGLKPDRELVRGLEDSPWLTFCGNCNKVHAMVESVVQEGKRAGQEAR